MLLMGIDLGTSSVKVSVIDSETMSCLASIYYPETEAPIISRNQGWAEQSPDDWWENVQRAILKLHAKKIYDPKDISAVGIAYQMHGLVMIGKDRQVLGNSIIWCDSRAVEIGNKAFNEIGTEKCFHHLLNSPGNFTASKLSWVKEHRPSLFDKIYKIMLPGDFIAMKMTGNLTTTIPALSEGIFWDFVEKNISEDVFSYFDFDPSIIPTISEVFGEHGRISEETGSLLSLKPGIPLTYKAGDQPNNAFSLNVLDPGEVAATAGTSGVIYGVTDRLTYDIQSRANSFAHVNHHPGENRIGVLLCINGCGSLTRWIKNLYGNGAGYAQLNIQAESVAPGSEGVTMIPFGNGAERMLNNRLIGARISGIDFNRHNSAHLYRAALEGVAFAFRYGLDVIRETNLYPRVIRVGKTNMFMSDLFTRIFVNTLKIPVEIYQTDGSIGAAYGAGMGAKVFNSTAEAFRSLKPVDFVEPNNEDDLYEELYEAWFKELDTLM